MLSCLVLYIRGLYWFFYNQIYSYRVKVFLNENSLYPACNVKRALIVSYELNIINFTDQNICKMVRGYQERATFTKHNITYDNHDRYKRDWSRLSATNKYRHPFYADTRYNDKIPLILVIWLARNLRSRGWHLIRHNARINTSDF